jgi:hypothetical protein
MFVEHHDTLESHFEAALGGSVVSKKANTDRWVTPDACTSAGASANLPLVSDIRPRVRRTYLGDEGIHGTL